MVKNKIIKSCLCALIMCGCGQGDTNYENVKKVKNGMTIRDVEKIMGKPDSIFSWPQENDQFRYRYEPPWGASDNIYIMFSKQDSSVVSKNEGS